MQTSELKVSLDQGPKKQEEEIKTKIPDMQIKGVQTDPISVDKAVQTDPLIDEDQDIKKKKPRANEPLNDGGLLRELRLRRELRNDPYECLFNNRQFRRCNQRIEICNCGRSGPIHVADPRSGPIHVNTPDAPTTHFENQGEAVYRITYNPSPIPTRSYNPVASTPNPQSPTNNPAFDRLIQMVRNAEANDTRTRYPHHFQSRH